MPFRPAAAPGPDETDGAAGHIDYRLARLALLQQFERGEIAQHEVCDAHPELRRAAAEVGTPVDEACPICEAELVLVTYVFGPRLPAHGRCISLDGEIERLARRKGNFTAYVVEACPACAWNHLRRSYPLRDPGTE